MTQKEDCEKWRSKNLKVRLIYHCFSLLYNVLRKMKMSCVSSKSNFCPESVLIDSSNCPNCAQAIEAATCHSKCQIGGPCAKIRMFSKPSASLGGWLPYSGKFFARKPCDSHIVENCFGVTDPGRIRTVSPRISCPSWHS